MNEKLKQLTKKQIAVIVGVLVIVAGGIAGVSAYFANSAKDIQGVWVQTNEVVDIQPQKALITKKNIDIYWIDEENGDALYWSGSVKVPRNEEQFKWTSKSNKDKMNTEDTEKEFSFADNKISYTVTVNGKDYEVVLERTSEEAKQEVLESATVTTTEPTTAETTTEVVTEAITEVVEETQPEPEKKPNPDNPKPKPVDPPKNVTNKKPAKEPEKKPNPDNPKPKPVDPPKPEKHVTPQEVQKQVNDYIRSKGIKVDSSLTKETAGYPVPTSASQEKLDSGYTLSNAKEAVDSIIKNYGPVFAKGMYCYYDGNSGFYILYK